MELAKIQAVIECQQLAVRFWNYTDEGDYESIAALFVAGGTWTRPEGLSLAAPAGILAYLAKRSKTITTCHVVSNVDVRFMSDTEMEATAYITAYITAYKHDDSVTRRSPAPLHGTHRILRSRDRYVHTPEGWRIAEKRVSHIFDAALS